jgi:hypothetical protein
MKIIQLLVRTNIVVLTDVEDPPKIWVDTSYTDVKRARADWPFEVYREVEILS